MYKALDVLSRQVEILSNFSDRPAKVTYNLASSLK